MNRFLFWDRIIRENISSLGRGNDNLKLKIICWIYYRVLFQVIHIQYRFEKVDFTNNLYVISTPLSEKKKLFSI